MSRPIEDRGFAVQMAKPLALRRFEPNRLPDPGQCVDCLIIVNDRHDGQPRVRLAVSNGASWDRLAWIDEISSAMRTTALAPVPAPLPDLRPLVAALVRELAPPQLAPTPGPTPQAANISFAATPVIKRPMIVAYEGIRYTIDDVAWLAVAMSCANAAIAAGVQGGNYRWHHGSADFVWPTIEGSPAPIDAPTILALGAKALSQMQ